MFPGGVPRLQRDEIAGPQPECAAPWARIQAAHMAPGFVLRASHDSRFLLYAKANGDAPRIWAVSGDLCFGLLGPVATVVRSEVESIRGITRGKWCRRTQAAVARGRRADSKNTTSAGKPDARSRLLC